MCRLAARAYGAHGLAQAVRDLPLERRVRPRRHPAAGAGRAAPAVDRGAWRRTRRRPRRTARRRSRRRRARRGARSWSRRSSCRRVKRGWTPRYSANRIDRHRHRHTPSTSSRVRPASARRLVDHRHLERAAVAVELAGRGRGIGHADEGGRAPQGAGRHDGGRSAGAVRRPPRRSWRSRSRCRRRTRTPAARPRPTPGAGSRRWRRAARACARWARAWRRTRRWKPAYGLTLIASPRASRMHG